MPGRVPGFVFKVAMAALPAESSAQLFPKLAARVSEMENSALYPWDDYTDLTQTIAAKMPADVLVEVGKGVIRASLPEYLRIGYATADSILKDWATLFNRYIQGAPSRDLVRTDSYAPGRVVIIGGVAQPAKLVEGYMRATVEEYGGAVNGFDTSQVIIGGATYNRFVMTWVSS